MEMINNPYIVYVKTNSGGYITAVNSSAFLPDTTGWTKIDEGYGDKYHHAQSGYFPDTLWTEVGAYRYKLVDGYPVECTVEEIAEQEAALVPDPGTGQTLEQRVATVESDVADLTAAIEKGLSL